MPTRRFFVFNFVRTLVYLVDYLIYPHNQKIPEETEHTNDLLKPLESFLSRYKMELYFVFTEEQVRFSKVIDETTLKELFESMIKDLKQEEYNPEVFAWFTVLLSYYGSISKRRNVESALKTVITVILDTIMGYDEDEKIKSDVIDDIKNNLKRTAELINRQQAASNLESLRHAQ